MKKAKISEQLISLLYVHDIHVSAYLQSRGLAPELQKVDNSRIVFCFPNSPDTQNMIKDYYSNPMVKLVDFVTVLRRLRAQMLSMRG